MLRSESLWCNSRLWLYSCWNCARAGKVSGVESRRTDVQEHANANFKSRPKSSPWVWFCSTLRSEGISSCVEVSFWLNRTERGPQNGKPVDAKMRSPPPLPFSQPIRSSGKPIRRCARRWPTQVKAKSTLSSSDSFGLSSSQGGEVEPIVGS